MKNFRARPATGHTSKACFRHTQGFTGKAQEIIWKLVQQPTLSTVFNDLNDRKELR
jgi:hypothetical protein